jgi:hypothetical protein
MFFDDMHHVLTEELGDGHGIQVPPYVHFTPIDTLAALLGVRRTPVHATAVKESRTEMREYVHTPPNYEAYMNEAPTFIALIRNFLSANQVETQMQSGGAVLSPAPLSSVNATTTWPGGVGGALLYSTDSQVQFKASGGRRKTRKGSRKSRKGRKASRKMRR